jgi:hypothetical protein
MPRKKKEETEKKPKAKKAAAPKASGEKKTRAKSATPRVKKTAAPKARSAKAEKTTAPTAKLPKTLNSKLVKMPRFGQTQMIAFVRDPQCIFTYWEVTPERMEEVKRELMDEYHGSSMVLRVFRTVEGGKSELLYEVKVEPGEMNRYVDLVEKGGSYFIEIGQKTLSGRFVPIARSNPIQTGIQWQQPASSAADPQWEPPPGIQEYFSEEIIEEAFEPEKKDFSASFPPKGKLGERKKFNLGRHAASHF